MKVLSVNNVFAWGSTGKIVRDIHEQLLSEGVESVVCFARQRGRVDNPPFVYKFCTELEGDIWHGLSRYFGFMPYGGMWFSTRRLISIIKKEQPDVVHLHCINDYSVNIYRLLRFLGENNIKTVVTHHAEFFYTGNCGHAYDCMKWVEQPGCRHCPNPRKYTPFRSISHTAKAWKMMRRAFAAFRKGNLRFTTVAPWGKSRLEMSPITQGFACDVVLNGLDDEVFHYWPKEPDTPFVLHVSARFSTELGHIKGGRYVVELAKRMPDVKFKVVCTLQSVDCELPENVELLGRASSQRELAELYSQAKVTLLTSRRETFSMPTAESLCCGTPVVGFKAGGPESIALKDYSSFVEYGNLDQLESEVRRMMALEYDKEEISTKACAIYSKAAMVRGYKEVYGKLLNIQQNDN